jgi:putative aminopeptidase FrvX
MRKSVISILGLALVLCAASPASQNKAPASSWDLFKKIVLIPGLSSQEGKVSDFIQAALPASLKAKRDTKANVWFTVGEGHPHLLFVAHLDELGFVIDKITPQGTALLGARGGLLAQACEARPFLVYTAKGPVEGVIQPRPDYYYQSQSPTRAQGQNPPRGQSGAGQNPAPTSPPNPTQKPAPAPAQPRAAPEALELYLGVSLEQEARALGVAEGNQVIFKKKLVDLAPDIIATRAVDDRAGCAALLDAALQTDWTKVSGKTITFAWDVEEEIGLVGAQALSKILKPDYVFAVDTFVSTDSPLENKRFGNAILGQGAVLRAIDSSNIIPKTEIRKIAELAKKYAIPLQIYNSRGGNDGSVFVSEGAVDIPLSWPGTSAHSFVEKICRSDLEALTRLIVAIMEDWK